MSMERYNGLASDPDAFHREREANLPRQVDEDSVRPIYRHQSTTWAQLQHVIANNPPFVREEK